MTGFIITEATREQLKLRLALTGTAGSGKTWTAMMLAQRIAERENTRFCVIDTEHGRAKLYAPDFLVNGRPCGHIDFAPPFGPDRYIEAIRYVEGAGFGVIVIDSMTHEWAGEGGALQLVDELGANGRGGKFYSGWAKVTPMHTQFIEAILQSPAHIIATMRSKADYLTDQQKGTVQKLGMAPIQREGADFEFDLVMDMEAPAIKATFSKSRCSAIPAGKVILKPKADLADTLLTWLNSGAEPAPRQQALEPEPEPERHPEPQQQRPVTNGTGRMTQGAAIPRREAVEPSQAAGWQDRPAAESQIKAAYTLARGAQAMDDGALEKLSRNLFGHMPAELSRRQISDLIDHLKLSGGTDTGLTPIGFPPKQRPPNVDFWLGVQQIGQAEPERGFLNDAGKITAAGKAAVHRALGLSEDDGALAAWVAIEGNSYDQALSALKLGIPVVAPEPAAQGELIGAGSTAYPDGR